MPLFKRNRTPRQEAMKELKREVKAAWKRSWGSHKYPWRQRYFCVFLDSGRVAYYYKRDVIDFREGVFTYCIDSRGRLYRGVESARHHHELFIGSRAAVERLELKATAEAQDFSEIEPWKLNLDELNEQIERVKTFAA